MPSADVAPHPFQALFDLRLVSGNLTLRLPDEREMVQLGHVAADGIHTPGHSPFISSWSEQSREQLVAGLLQSHWRKRAQWSPQSWELVFAVFVDEQVIGAQSLRAENFTLARQVDTGSWLGQQFQGRGYGKRMRAAVLALAFEGLNAQRATTEAFVDNAASNAVSLALGYEPDGSTFGVRGDQVRESNRYLLTRHRWQGSFGQGLGTGLVVSEQARSLLGA